MDRPRLFVVVRGLRDALGPAGARDERAPARRTPTARRSCSSSAAALVARAAACGRSACATSTPPGPPSMDATARTGRTRRTSSRWSSRRRSATVRRPGPRLRLPDTRRQRHPRLRPCRRPGRRPRPGGRGRRRRAGRCRTQPRHRESARPSARSSPRSPGRRGEWSRRSRRRDAPATRRRSGPTPSRAERALGLAGRPRSRDDRRQRMALARQPPGGLRARPTRTSGLPPASRRSHGERDAEAGTCRSSQPRWEPPAAAAPAPLRVAYIMSRFPKLTETFILFEMSAVERQGLDIWLFPLLHEREATMHPEAAPYVARATLSAVPVAADPGQPVGVPASLPATLLRRHPDDDRRHLAQPELPARRARDLPQGRPRGRSDGARRRASRALPLRDPSGAGRPAHPSSDGDHLLVHGPRL